MYIVRGLHPPLLSWSKRRLEPLEREVDVSTRHRDGTVFVNRLKETANNQDCSLLSHMHELSSVHLPKTLFPSMVQHMFTTACVEAGRPRANPHFRNLSSYQKFPWAPPHQLLIQNHSFHLPDCGVISLSLPTGPTNQLSPASLTPFAGWNTDKHSGSPAEFCKGIERATVRRPLSVLLLQAQCKRHDITTSTDDMMSTATYHRQRLQPRGSPSI